MIDPFKDPILLQFVVIIAKLFQVSDVRVPDLSFSSSSGFSFSLSKHNFDVSFDISDD